MNAKLKLYCASAALLLCGGRLRAAPMPSPREAALADPRVQEAIQELEEGGYARGQEAVIEVSDVCKPRPGLCTRTHLVVLQFRFSTESGAPMPEDNAGRTYPLVSLKLAVDIVYDPEADADDSVKSVTVKPTELIDPEELRIRF